MARVLNVVVLVLGVALGAAVVAVGVVGVLSRRLDPTSAAMVGGLALAVVEVAMALSHRLRVTPAVAGTWWGRAVAVVAAGVAALGLAAVIGPGGRPTSASVLVGTAAVVVLIALIGVQATRADRAAVGPDGSLDS
jgi:hypothetical protein